jgi:hypothetical protein
MLHWAGNELGLRIFFCKDEPAKSWRGQLFAKRKYAVTSEKGGQALFSAAPSYEKKFAKVFVFQLFGGNPAVLPSK